MLSFLRGRKGLILMRRKMIIFCCLGSYLAELRVYFCLSGIISWVFGGSFGVSEIKLRPAEIKAKYSTCCSIASAPSCDFKVLHGSASLCVWCRRAWKRDFPFLYILSNLGHAWLSSDICEPSICIRTSGRLRLFWWSQLENHGGKWVQLAAHGLHTGGIGLRPSNECIFFFSPRPGPAPSNECIFKNQCQESSLHQSLSPKYKGNTEMRKCDLVRPYRSLNVRKASFTLKNESHPFW